MQAEIRGLDGQVNDLRKYHDKLVQDRLRSTAKLAQLKDSIKVSRCACAPCLCSMYLSHSCCLHMGMEQHDDESFFRQRCAAPDLQL